MFIIDWIKHVGVGECSLEKTIITCVNEDILDDQVNNSRDTANPRHVWQTPDSIGVCCTVTYIVTSSEKKAFGTLPCGVTLVTRVRK